MVNEARSRYLDVHDHEVLAEVELAARAGNRRFWLSSALRAHTKAPYRTGLHRESLTTPGGPDREAEADAEVRVGHVVEAGDNNQR